MSCHYHTNEDIDMWSFLPYSRHRAILSDMRYTIMPSMVVEISPFMLRGHDYVVRAQMQRNAPCFAGKNAHEMINYYPGPLYDAPF